MNRFSERLLSWYDQHGRHGLPWHTDPTPYRVWVSEIMLQQTQVATVIPYYARFLTRFPSVTALAAAPLDDVLHHWSGLGYYARARNLQRAAQQIVNVYGGEFPRVLGQLVALPGIGRSTAGAILALSHGDRHAILDGNVKRVLTRVHCIPGWPDAPAVQKSLWQLAETHTPHTRVAAYTQAIMDLGATLCTRRQPDCAHCPVAEYCEARATSRQHDFPGRKPRRTLPQRSTRFLIAERADGALLLERRPPTGIWGGLWGFPELPDDADAALVCRQLGLGEPDTPIALPKLAHTFTHFQLEISPLLVRVPASGGVLMDSDSWLWYNDAAPARIGLAKPVAQLITSLRTRNAGD